MGPMKNVKLQSWDGGGKLQKQKMVGSPGFLKHRGGEGGEEGANWRMSP